MKNGRIDKYLFGGGYAQASVASSTTDNFAFYYYNSTGSVLLITFPSKKLSMMNKFVSWGRFFALQSGIAECL